MPELSVPIRTRGVLVRVLLRTETSLCTEPLLAYLDTGASDTMLDVGMARRLGLRGEPTAALSVLGRPGVSFHERHDVDIALVVPDGQPRWLALPVLVGAVYATGAILALGRDFLSQIEFIYDGPGKRAVLRW